MSTPVPVNPLIAKALAKRGASRARGAGKSQRSGQWGEDRVAAFRSAARLRGICRVEKVPVPTKTLRGNRIVRAHRSTVDGVGYFYAFGRAIAEEVKTFSAKSRLQLSEVEEHQREFLDDTHRAGGFTLLTVVHRDRVTFTTRVFACPWPLVRDRVSLSLDDLSRWETDGDHYPYPKTPKE